MTRKAIEEQIAKIGKDRTVECWVTVLDPIAFKITEKVIVDKDTYKHDHIAVKEEENG